MALVPIKFKVSDPLPMKHYIDSSGKLVEMDESGNETQMVATTSKADPPQCTCTHAFLNGGCICGAMQKERNQPPKAKPKTVAMKLRLPKLGETWMFSSCGKPLMASGQSAIYNHNDVEGGTERGVPWVCKLDPTTYLSPSALAQIAEVILCGCLEHVSRTP